MGLSMFDRADLIVSAPTARALWVDWLRILGVAGIFVAHVCQVFMPWIDWFVANDTRSRVAGVVALVMAPWILPLLMMCAGFAAWHAFQRRTDAQFVRERTLRVLLPAVVGVLLLVPPQLYVERRLQGQFDGSYFAFLPHFFTDGLYPRGNFALRHLWFLAYLYLASLLALPLFRYWSGDAGAAQLGRLAGWLSKRWGWLWLAIPLTAERQLTRTIASGLGLPLLEWSSESAMLVAYVFGFAIAARPELRELVDRKWPRAFGMALVLTAIQSVLAWLGYFPSRLPPASTTGAFLFWAAYTLGGCAWVVAVVGLGRRYLRSEGRLFSYARRSAYGWYLVHQTAIVVVAAWVVTWPLGVVTKLFALALLAAATTAAGAVLVNRLLPRARSSGVTRVAT
jgi:hypothetical protein